MRWNSAISDKVLISRSDQSLRIFYLFIKLKISYLYVLYFEGKKIFFCFVFFFTVCSIYRLFSRGSVSYKETESDLSKQNRFIKKAKKILSLNFLV